MSERRSRPSGKPQMIGPPAALIYDTAECVYPGLIRVSFDDGHTVVYSAYEAVKPAILAPEPVSLRCEYEPMHLRKRRRPGIPSKKRRLR